MTDSTQALKKELSKWWWIPLVQGIAAFLLAAFFVGIQKVYWLMDLIVCLLVKKTMPAPGLIRLF